MKDLYKVMIVESKRQMIHIYKNMIPWEEYGFEVSLVTSNESKALSYYGEYKHDLILTDIDLKTGNGISLIKKLKRLNKNCIVVVIANHDDFDTVREAFVAGAYDYLLKSRIRYSALADILEKVKIKLIELKKNEQEDNWEIVLEKILGLIRDKQIVDHHLLNKILCQADFQVLQGNYRMLYFRHDNIINFNRSMKQYDKPDWLNTNEFVDMYCSKISLRDEIQSQLKKIINEHIQNIPGAIVQFIKKHSGLIILPNMSEEKCHNLAKNIMNTIHERLTYDFSITISTENHGIESFVQLYQDLIKCHDMYKFYDGDTCVEHMNDKRSFQSIPNNMYPYKEQIVQGISEQNFQKTEEGYIDAVNFMIEHKIYPTEVKEYFINALQLTELMFEKRRIEEKYPFYILSDGIMESESIMYLKLELEKMFKTLIDWSKDHKVSKYHKKVATMLDFIDQHISEKISLEQVADAAELSQTHASRMFKSDLGTSIVDYINQRKMMIAEEMMHDEKKKIKDISIAVGIQDQLYFNKVFKKYYQMSPREYKKKL